MHLVCKIYVVIIIIALQMVCRAKRTLRVVTFVITLTLFTCLTYWCYESIIRFLIIRFLNIIVTFSPQLCS